MKPLRLLLTMVLAAVAQPCSAATFRQNKGAASMEVRYDSDERKLALADLITVTLTIEGSPSLRTPIAPLELPANAPWVLVERSKLDRETLEGKRLRYRLTYRFAPREPGKKVAFQFPDVKFTDSDKPQQTVSWVPITFEVVTQIAQPDRTPLKDITAIEELPPEVPAGQSWLVWTAIVAASMFLVAVAVILREFLRRRVPRTAAGIALYELHRLVAMKLPEQGRSERFITLLTTLVRRYLERQFALPARRQTTPEFLQQLDQAAPLTADEKQFLATFLMRCEAIKFADQSMAPAECQQCAEAVRDFLQRRLTNAESAALRA